MYLLADHQKNALSVCVYIYKHGTVTWNTTQYKHKQFEYDAETSILTKLIKYDRINLSDLFSIFYAILFYHRKKSIHFPIGYIHWWILYSPISYFSYRSINKQCISYISKTFGDSSISKNGWELRLALGDANSVWVLCIPQTIGLNISPLEIEFHLNHHHSFKSTCVYL